MSNLVQADTSKGAIMESVIIKGDLGQLTPQERSTYYMKVCESVGLNPLTRPFEYITLNNKLTLYARRDATDQLRNIHEVSVQELAESEREGVFIVTAKVANTKGRTDIAKGAVNIANLKGEMLANAMMKAETKAKRRATLSICGLGFLDETEVETIKDAKPVDIEEIEAEPTLNDYVDDIKNAPSLDGLEFKFRQAAGMFKGDEPSRKKLIEAKDRRKAEIEGKIVSAGLKGETEALLGGAAA